MKADNKTIFRIGLAAFLLFLCIYYWTGITHLLTGILAAMTPLLLGFIVAYMVNILMSMYEKHLFGRARGRVSLGLKRPVCMLLAFVSLSAIIACVFVLIVPELISCLSLLGQEIPRVLERGLRWLQDNVDPSIWKNIETFLGGERLDWQAIIKKAADFFAYGFGGIVGTMTTVITRTFSGLVTFLVGMIFSIYLLAGKEKLGAQVSRLAKHYLKPSWFRRSSYVLRVFHNSSHRFIVGQCTEAVILGVLCTLGMMLFRFPYANMIGALVGFTALIPVAGAYIGAGVGAFMIFTVSPIQGLFFLLFIVILQQLEGNVVYPRVVGASIGLPGIWVLASITLGGALFGIGGMLLGVPLTASIYQILRDDMDEQTLRRGV